MKKFVAAFVLSLVACSAVQAATVTVYLDQNKSAGTWQLSLKSSTGDNAGIASYSIPLITPVTALDHKSPRAGAAENADGSLSGSMGFTLFRSADGTSAASMKIAGSQDNIAPTPFLIYGFGQTAGSFQTVSNGPATPLGSNEGNNWTDKPIIASGTFTPGGFVKIDRTSVDLVANTFNTVGGLDVSPATIVIVPEPATLAMIGAGLVGLVAVRRRMA